MLEEELGFPKTFVVKPFDCHLDSVNEDINIFAPCKAYVLSEDKKYHKDGSCTEKYSVVFTWDEGKEDEIKPKFDDKDELECSNAVEVKAIFDNFFQCYYECSDMNSEILNATIQNHKDISANKIKSEFDEYETVVFRLMKEKNFNDAKQMEE
jgi:hypothetical protein